MKLEGKKFYLLGYSFGVMVAIEMASMLEEQGKLFVQSFITLINKLK